MTDNSNLVVLEVKRPDEALFKRSENALETARKTEIRTPDEAVWAGKDLTQIKTLAKQLEAKRTAITGPLNKALKEVNALFKPAKTWLKEAEGLLKPEILRYQAEQDRIAREAQAKADAEAHKEREKLELKAKLAAVVGMEERAEELREEAETRIAPVVTSAAPKLAGVVTRETWRAEVTDLWALVMHIVEKQPALMVMIKIDQSLLNARARELKENFDLPGVKAIKEMGIAAHGQ